MDKDVKDLIILLSLLTLTGYGAATFNSQSVLMLGIGGGFTFFGIKYGANVLSASK